MINKIISIFRKRKTQKNLKYKETDALNLINSISGKRDIDLLIGDEILEVRILFQYSGINNWLDTSIAFINLKQNGIINFPFSGDDNFENVSIEINAKTILEKYQKIIYRNTIKDIYYILDEENEEFDNTQSGYIVLSNGYVLDENRMSPSGTGMAGFFCKTNEDFKKELNINKNKIYSVKNKTLKQFN